METAVLDRPAFPGFGTGNFDAEAIAGVARALAHPARIRIIDLLLSRPGCIGCDIVEEVNLAQSTVSEHLRILKAANLVTGELARPRVCYAINPDALAPLAALLGTIVARAEAGSLDGSICCPPEGCGPIEDEQ